MRSFPPGFSPVCCFKRSGRGMFVDIFSLLLKNFLLLVLIEKVRTGNIFEKRLIQGIFPAGIPGFGRMPPLH